MSEARAVDPRDPRFLPFRGAMYVLYFLFVTAFSLLAVRSVVRSLVTMSPPRVQAERTVPVAQCEREGAALFGAMDEERRALAGRSPVAEVDAEWSAFRTRWMKRYREVESRCALDAPDRARLKESFVLLLKVLDLYTTHAIQFAGEVGPTVDRLAERLPIRDVTATQPAEPPVRVTH